METPCSRFTSALNIVWSTTTKADWFSLRGRRQEETVNRRDVEEALLGLLGWLLLVGGVAAAAAWRVKQ